MKCPKCEFSYIAFNKRFCTKCGYEIDPNYESKKRLRRFGCFSLILLGIVFIFVVMSMLAYLIGAGICFISFGAASTCEEPLSYLGISGTVGWIEWLWNILG
ncbi:MAG: hypothetical protein FI687_06995 [SAR202 cluster bacterium]|nr:hypothetical protein [SAR202 cluster bacterium]|tara:strand:- start:17699 stop:18004 length:306 start_codon:yes stop_codon:yes gene_type:complete